MSGGPPLSILHVIARLNVGGAALHVAQLAAEQQRRGHRVLVVAGTIPPGEESMEHLADELGFPYQRLAALNRDLSLRNDTSAIRALVRILRAERPDVLHTHTAKAGATGRIAALLAGSGRPRALVHTYHGHVLSGYFSAPRTAVFRQIERLLARRTAALIAVSPQVRDDLVAMRIAPPERFAVIPYGFDLSGRIDRNGAERDRVRAELGVGEGGFVVGWVGRLTAIKRPQDLVRTLHALVGEGVDATLCVVGDGPERPGAEALASSLGIGDRCRFAGYQKDLAPWYAAFDALCLTSANEGTPVAAIEALAAERPVVATRVGGVPAVVEDGESGFLAEPGDTHGLAAALAQLARDPGLCEQMGRRGAGRMQELYATERMVEEIEALYRHALAVEDPGA
jgi:glycosyltransferase involved in cell wall biosynthesis